MKRYLNCLVALGAFGITALGTVEKSRSQGLTPAQDNQLQQLLQLEDAAAFTEQSQSFWQSVRNDLDASAASDVQQALGSRAKQWLEDASTLQTLDVAQARTLGSFASYGMTAAQKSQLAQQIESTLSDPATTSYEQLASRVALLSGLNPKTFQGQSSNRSFVDEWLKAHDLSSLTQEQLNTCFPYARPVVSGEEGFQATWSGFITPPTSGSYTFSVSPWKISMMNVERGEVRSNRQTMTVRVNGQLVVNATPEAWNYEGTPIELTGGEKVSLQVQFLYERKGDDRLCPVVLKWQGPGVTKSVVPSSALSFNEEGSPGLQAEYVWNQETSEGQSQQVVEQIVDPNIDFVWLDGLTVDARTEAMRRLAAELVNRWTEPDGDFVGDLARRPQIVALLTSSQLASCLEALSEHPQQLQDVSATRLWRFYFATRCGADEEAVDMLGTWMTQHQDPVPEIVPFEVGFFKINRQFYRRLADYLAFEYPQAMSWLEEGYLESEDGRCVLPAAYTLAYCYLTKGQIDEWIQSLDERLSDESLTGDKRVNWLLARGMAEEIRHGLADRFHAGPELLPMSKEWLDEAALVAESPDTKLRILQERIARLAAMGLWEEAEAEVSQAAPASPQAQAQVAAWTSQVSSAKSVVEAREKTREEAAQQAYIDELRRRRSRAAEREDDQAVTHYDILLSELESVQE